MQAVEKFLLTALGLIALYLVLNARNLGGTVESISRGLSSVFRTLQGRG